MSGADLLPAAPTAAEAAASDRQVSYWSVVGGQLRKNGAAMAALRVVLVLLAVAVGAPALASNLPFAWQDAQGLSFPLAETLFDRFLYPGGVDVFFNLVLAVAPLWWLAGRAGRRPWRGFAALPWAVGREPRASAVLLAGTILVVLQPRAGLPAALGAAGWAAALVPLPWSGRGAILVAAAGLGLLAGQPTAGLLLAAVALPDLAALLLLAQAVGAVATGAPALSWMLLLVGLPGAAAVFLAARGRRLRARGAAAACAVLFLAGFAVLQTSLHETRAVKDWKALAPSASLAIFPPSPFHPDNVGETGSDSIVRSLRPPGGANVLGCDLNGRDVAARMIFGTRISMTIGLVAVSLFVTIGVILGSLAGYYLGWVDTLIQRLIEVMICFPTLFLLLTIIAVFDTRSIFMIMAAIGVVGWPGVARLVRAEFLRQRGLDYVTAAAAQGIPQRRIIFGHVLPNCMGPVLVSATLGVAASILTESGLAFLGLGDANTASWGQMLTSGRDTHMWHLILVPGFAIFLVVTVFNLLGEGLRDALDPKLRR